MYSLDSNPVCLLKKQGLESTYIRGGSLTFHGPKFGSLRKPLGQRGILKGANLTLGLGPVKLTCQT